MMKRFIPQRSNSPWVRALGITALGLAAVAPLAAEPPEAGPPGLFRAPELDVQASLRRFEQGSQQAADKPGIRRFFELHSDAWEIFWDERADRPHLIQGRGVALLPGRGNDLETEDLALPRGAALSMSDVEQIVRRFLDEHPELLRVDPNDLVLRTAASGNFGKERELWLVELRQHHEGIPVFGAHAIFRIKHGNLIQLGTRHLAEIRLSNQVRLDAAEALERVLKAADFTADEVSEVLEAGELLIYPQLPPGERPGQRYRGPAGAGYHHVLVWKLVFRRAGDRTTYQALVDAGNGRVLELTDRNRYALVSARVTGGVRPGSPRDLEESRPFSFTTVIENGVEKTTNAAGDYSHEEGSSTTVSLDGQYISIDDRCGSILVPGDANGDVDLGTSPGTDCAVAGEGNTDAARTAFFHLTDVNRAAKDFLPGVPWLDAKLTVNTNSTTLNPDGDCQNSYWDSLELNFFRSVGPCDNAGATTGILVHEWAHGLDQATGGDLSDSSSAEAFSDATTMLHLGTSCIGKDVFTDLRNCPGCTSCTGLRDPGEFALHNPYQTQPGTPVTPRTVEDLGCVCNPDNPGTLGYDAHCESQIAGAAFWDLREELVAGHGDIAGLDFLELIWYLSVADGQSAYRLAAGNACDPSSFVTDGCAIDNWHQVFLAADDDDGDLTNGTPNQAYIEQALAAHCMACVPGPAADAGADPPPVCLGNCVTIGTPEVAGLTYLWPTGETTGQITVCPSVTTTYGLTVTDGCGKSGVDEVTVTVHGQPTADAGPDRVICPGGSADLGTPVTPENSCVWSPDGQTISEITVSPLGTTSYELTCSTACGSAMDDVQVCVSGLDEDFEGGLGGWTANGLWHLVNATSCAAGNSSTVAYHGHDSTCDYNPAGNGELISPVICDVGLSSTLSFDFFRDVDNVADNTVVEVTPAGLGVWQQVWPGPPPEDEIPAGTWTSSDPISLAAWAGSSIEIRFRFTADSVDNTATGWMIDNVVVTGQLTCNAPAVVITSPADGAMGAVDSPTTFTATASDPEDGDLCASVVWTSDRDGELGTGCSTTATLSEGSHQVTAEARDSSGLSSSDTIGFFVKGPCGISSNSLLFGDGTLSSKGHPPGCAALFKAADGEKVPDQYIVVLRDGLPVPEAAREMAAAHGGELLHTFQHALQGFAARIPEGRVGALLRDPRVLRVEEDVVFTVSGDQATPPWGLDRIDERDLPLDNNYHWDFGGTGVDAFVLDTGIRTTHVDFGGRATWGADCTGEGQIDNHGHGSHLAGILGGATYGVAKNVNLFAVKVCTGGGSCPSSATLCGIDFVVAQKQASPSRPMVANMSLGGPFSQTSNDAVANGVAAGVFFAVAAGNNNSDACGFSPSSEPTAYTVGSTTSSDTRSSFSNFGTCVDIFAPGSSITSTWNTSDTATNTISGTSMASPQVAGAAALVLEEHPTWTPAQVGAELDARATQGVISNPGAGSPNALLFTLDAGQPVCTTLHFADFESGGADGWTQGNDTCTTGSFVVGNPDAVVDGGVQTQVGGSASGTGSFFTQPNTGGAGTDDVDGGTCEALSPVVRASGTVTISLDYFHGQRDAGDDAGDGFSIEVLQDGTVVDTIVAIGDVTHNAAWTNVSTMIDAGPGSDIRLRVRATDAAAAGDIFEGGIDNVEICGDPVPQPPCTVDEDFETGGAVGWFNSSASTCTAGDYVLGNPTLVTNGGVTTQVGGSNSGVNSVFTATNSSAGVDDVDGGNCLLCSPSWRVPTASTLSVAWWHGQRDADDDAGDFFLLEYSTDAGATWHPLASNDDSTSNAEWATATAPVPAGSDVVLRVQCSDGAGPGDLIECGIDDVSICPN